MTERHQRAKKPAPKKDAESQHLFSSPVKAAKKTAKPSRMSVITIMGVRPDELRDLRIALGLQGYPSLNAFFKAQIRATITVAKQQLPDCFDRLHPNLIAQQILHVLTGVTVSATLKELRLAIGDPVTEYQLRQALALLEEEKLIDRSKDYVLDPSSGRPTYRWRKKSL